MCPPPGARRAARAKTALLASRTSGGARMPRSLGQRREPACKPGSVEGNHSSGTRVAASLERPTRKRVRSTAAPSRAPLPYLALLQVGFTVPPVLPPARCALTAPFHPCRPAPMRARTWAVCSLLHFPWARAPQALPGTSSAGARTFLHPLRPCGREKTAIARPAPAHKIIPNACALNLASIRARARMPPGAWLP